MSAFSSYPAVPSFPGKGDLVAQRLYYNRVYSAIKPEKLARDAMDPAFLAYAVDHLTSWHGMYRGDFERRLRGKRVLEIGAGNGLNALVMARLGANVSVFEISDVAIAHMEAAARLAGLEITARSDDFLAATLEPFDFVVGKAFLHHLPADVEELYIAKVSDSLDAAGEARFVEPAVNSEKLDALRWLIPVPGRPSVLQREKFRKWSEDDPHPDRPYTTQHFLDTGRRHFNSVHIEAFGGLKRIERFFRDRDRRDAVGRACLRLERRLLPNAVATAIARTQLIVYQEPKR